MAKKVGDLCFCCFDCVVLLLASSSSCRAAQLFRASAECAVRARRCLASARAVAVAASVSRVVFFWPLLVKQQQLHSSRSLLSGPRSRLLAATSECGDSCGREQVFSALRSCLFCCVRALAARGRRGAGRGGVVVARRLAGGAAANPRTGGTEGCFEKEFLLFCSHKQ